MAASEGTRGPDPSVHCAPLAELFHLASDVDFRHPRLEHRHAVLVDRVRDRDDRLLRLAARKATSGVPGRFQCAIEMLVEMVESGEGHRPWQPHVHRSARAHRVRVGRADELLDFLPVDLPGRVIALLGLSDVISHHRIVPTADLNGTLGIALGVFVLMIYYSIKIKGAGGSCMSCCRRRSAATRCCGSRTLR
jgi:F-type H+-transporting ATPase subunit a